MRWQQPSTGPAGVVVLREESRPCPQGCGGEWHHPVAEAGRVVGPVGVGVQQFRGGLVWQSQQEQQGDVPDVEVRAALTDPARLEARRREILRGLGLE